MADRKMRQKAGIRMLAAMTAAGLLIMQPMLAFASEQPAETVVMDQNWEETVEPLSPTVEPQPTEPPSPTVEPEPTQPPSEPVTPTEPAPSEVPKENAGTSDTSSVPETGETVNPETGTPEAETSNSEDQEEGAGTNEELIARQQIVELPAITWDFRFWTVSKQYAFAKKNLSIMEEMRDGARKIGMLKTKGLCYILNNEENGWLYVESGSVRGFVKASDVLTDKEGQTMLKAYQKLAKEKASKEGGIYTGIDTVAPLAREVVPALENRAFSHLRATVNQTVVDKEYAVVTADELHIREEKSTDSRIVGTMRAGDLCYILADKNKKWIFIESGDVRGFVKKEYLTYGSEVHKQIEETGEDSYTYAEKTIEPEENQACYYTLTSIKAGVPGGEKRRELLEFAAQFIGNPYVYGGTSLTNGADCSGFVQSIFRSFGYELPRTSAAQSQYGTQIPVEQAQPGDLVFYAENGSVYHVVIYAGDGKTIEAMGENYGIVQANLDTAHAVWATRIL